MVALRHFVTIEESISAAIRPSVSQAARDLMQTVTALVERGMHQEAHREVDAFSLHGAVEQARNKIEELGVSALLFGAHHVTGSVQKTALAKGTRPIPHALKAGVDQLTLMIERSTADLIRDAAHEAIRQSRLQSLAKDELSVGELAVSGGLQNPEQGSGEGSPLYVHRKVLNGAQIAAWAKAQGFKSMLPEEELHVTVCYSKQPMDWGKVPRDESNLILKPAKREMDVFGPAIVLKVNSADLTRRHQQFRDAGASSDFPEYKAHVTITYEGVPPEVTAYDGEIWLGPEVYGVPQSGWADDMEETKLKKAADAALANALNDAVLNNGKMMVDIGANLTTSRLVSLGFLDEAEGQGVIEYQVTEILDDRICPVCEYMHGKTFSVQSEKSRVMQALLTQDPASLKDIAPWPKQSKAALEDLYGMSPDELQAAGFGSPPYHPGCRGVIVMTGEVEELKPFKWKSKAPALNPLLDGLKGPAEAAFLQDLLDELPGDVGDLDPEEIQQLLEATWSATKKKPPIKKSNPHHAADGTFTSADGAGEGGGGESSPKASGSIDHDTIRAAFKSTDDEAVATYAANMSMHPKDFQQAMTGMQPADVTMSTWYGALDVRMRLMDFNGEKVGECARSINFKTGEVKHEYLELEEKFQNGGFAKTLLASQVSLYQELGMKSVGVDANIDVGGYAWAKYGFVPTRESWKAFQPDLQQYIDDNGNLDPEEHYALMTLATSTDPKALWAIADSAHGKDLLLGSGWSGKLDLRDEEAMARFNQYVSKRK